METNFFLTPSTSTSSSSTITTRCKDLRQDPEKAVLLNKKHPVKEMNKACSTGTENEGGWKTFKSVQMKEYGTEITTAFKRFTSRIPEEASTLAKKHNNGKLRTLLCAKALLFSICPRSKILILFFFYSFFLSLFLSLFLFSSLPLLSCWWMQVHYFSACRN